MFKDSVEKYNTMAIFLQNSIPIHLQELLYNFQKKEKIYARKDMVLLWAPVIESIYILSS